MTARTTIHVDKAGKPCPICAMDFEELGEYIDGCGICFDTRLIDKETQIIECPNCYGRGEVWALDMISCAHCNGQGVVRR